MKKTFRLFSAAVAAIVFASCADEMGSNINVPESDASAQDCNLVQMTFSASMEKDVDSKTSLVSSTGDVLWEGTESITVFSKGSEANPQEFSMNWCSEDKTKASFTGVAYLDADSYYAVYPHSADNSCTADGELLVTIPSEQMAVADGFASGANVSVAAWKNGDLSLENDVIFKNVCSLITFEFATEADAILTESVKIKVKKNSTDYWGIAGQVKVCFENNVLTVKEGTEQVLTVKEPSLGFRKGVKYYAPVCPVGEIAGIELTYHHKDGKTVCTKTNNTPDTFTRNSLFNMGTLPVAYEDLLEVTLDFSNGWPFTPTTPMVKTSEQKSGGEEYILPCTIEENGVKRTENITFVITAKGTSGGSGYDYDTTNKCLKMGSSEMTKNRYGSISIPYVQNMYISAIIVYGKSTTGGKWSRNMIQKGGFPSQSVGGATTGAAYMEWNTGTVFMLPYVSGGVEQNIPMGGSDNTTVRDYSIGFRDSKMGIRSITYVYTKTQPQ